MSVPPGCNWVSSRDGWKGGKERRKERKGESKRKERRNKQKALMMFKIVCGMTSRYLNNIFSARPGASVCSFRTSQDDIVIPRA